MKLPEEKFAVILADPPWKYKTYNEKGRKKCPDWKPFKGSPSIHYDTMDLLKIKNIPVEQLAKKDCVLLLWVTMPMLMEGLDVIKAWGFKYKTCGFSWMKQNPKAASMFIDTNDIFKGTGYWTRANVELCLLATRGHPSRLNSDVPQAVFSPRREHSRKPTQIYDRIERLLAGPYIELFARSKRDGWTSFGNQVFKFKATKPNPVNGGKPDTVKSTPRKGVKLCLSKSSSKKRKPDLQRSRNRLKKNQRISTKSS